MVINNFHFSSYTIHSKSDLDAYEAKIMSVEKNPFYSKELLNISISKNKALHYFTFSVDNELVILMPFYKRKIGTEINDVDYYDVISPYGYNGPLISNKASKQDLIQFWRCIDKWYLQENIVSEFLRFSLNNNTTGYNGVLIPSLKNINGKIIDSDTQWSQLKQKVRNNYRKAVSEDLKIKIFTENELTNNVVAEFYDIYISTMHRNNAKDIYFYSKEYFEKFIKNNKKSAAIALVYKDQTVISVELILLHQKTAYSFLGGTLSDYFHTRPNDFLKIEVMNWAREHGYKNYVLGGGRTDDDGLYKYKKSFFPKDEDVIFYTGRKILNLKVYKKLGKTFCKEDNIETKISFKDSFFPYYRKSV